MTLEERRRMLAFRSWHRGTREMDLIMGSFADAHLRGFDAGQLDAYERLLAVPDPDLYDWKCGRGAPGPREDGPVMRLFLAHAVSAL